MSAVLRSANPRTAAKTDAAFFARERALAVNRGVYEWDRLPGLPPYCKVLPPEEKTTRREAQRIIYDLASTLAEALFVRQSFSKKLRDDSQPLQAYEELRPQRKRPLCATNWRTDREFARQRLNGVNPMMITRVDHLPAHFNVTDEIVRPVLPTGTTLAQLRDQGRLYICDWKALIGVPVAFGRFLTAPTVLFWVDPSGTLMPLAIQLDRDETVRPDTTESGPALVFTPADDPWLWLTVRSHVQSADAAYHEMVVHLLRTHLIMETVWVATNRGLAPQHPVHEMLKPHFQGTIAINHKARKELIAPGGPIDLAISVGSEGAYWLINQGLNDFSFTDLNPINDLAARNVDDRDALPGYYYRDDATITWQLISDYTEEVLRSFYPTDESVQLDDELTLWARELTDADCGAIRGIPLVDGRFQRFEDLHHVLRQVIFTVSAEHSAVNNGQNDIYGHIPNSPGALFLPHPRTKDVSSEGEFTYGLPAFKVAQTQIALVHMLSNGSQKLLGDFPAQFFDGNQDVRIAVDRFQDRLDQLTITISERNSALEVPYTYLDPAAAACSVSI